MNIIPNQNICNKKKLTSKTEYEVLEIDDDLPGTPDEYYKIKNDIGEDIWIDDWDCTKIALNMKKEYGGCSMKDALELNISGLKCDNNECNFMDMNIKAEDYEKWLNAKCPKCGEILLTEADFKNTKFLLEMTDLVNKIYPKRKEAEKIVSITVNMDGSGKMDFDIKK